MKTVAVVTILVCLTSGAFAQTGLETLEEMGRVFFLDSSGALTVNETSIIYGLLIAVPLILVALVVLPALGVDLNNLFGTERSDTPVPIQYYQEYAERSLGGLDSIFAMVQKALSTYK